ncbi:hypothetical protein GCM10017083_40260 [Thalassobaculum fulvum]|uniref:Uncharacterized protein n=1 Tax=Thalassobaculum fulvum TaxID=1633335 RepID=A0A918XVF9_9PROT|nr:hypothetical protein [Thalassobaculum fulvum]GHD58009.1 hypothetical protein GCM10017083_40260 [Thalassobaculum fulvum]
MIWLGALALLVVVAVVAAVVMLRGNRSPAPAVADPAVERRRGATPAPSGGGLGDRLREAVARQREQAGRLTAGHVQLIDVGAMVEGASAAGLSPAKALQVAEEVARRMIRQGDLLVRMEPDGVAILFDGATRAEAEAKSRQIAEATLAALGEVGAGGRYLAEGFGYELDEVLDGAVIDTVDDLIRFVHIAHRSYVAKQRGLARQLEKGVSLIRREIRAGNGGVVIGQEIAVCRRAGDGGRETLREEGFAELDPAVGAETDCVVLEKLGTSMAAVLAGSDEPVYVPARLSSLVNPLYLGNLRAALDGLPPTVRQRLVLVVDPGAGAVRTLLPKATELLRTRVIGLAARVRDPATDVATAEAAGFTTVVLDSPERRFDDPVAVVGRFRSSARDAGLTAIVLDAGDAVASLPGGIAHSRSGPG